MRVETSHYKWDRRKCAAMFEMKIWFDDGDGRRSG